MKFFCLKAKKTGRELFFSAYPAECINGNTQKCSDILQLYPIDQSGVASVELFVSFLGRKLESFHKHVTEFFVDVLMQDPSPVGYIDILFVKGIQFVYMENVDFTIRKGFNTLYGWLFII